MNLSVKHILMLLLFFASCEAIAQPVKNNARIVINENKSWLFVKDPANNLNVLNNSTAHWQPVDLPHTWNIDDVMDDTPGYYRGAGWYKKTITISNELKGKNIFLYF